MKKFQILAVVAFVCCSAGQSHAATQEFNDLLYFEGIWDCEGKALDAASNELHDASSLFAVTAMLGGDWIQATIFENNDHASVQVGSRFLGYDATWKRFVSYEVGRAGAWSFASTADSLWGTVQWSGYLHNFRGQMSQELEENVRIVSDDAFTWVSKIKTSSGNDNAVEHWVTLYDGSCHRQTS